jgi:hypothetical protein
LCLSGASEMGVLQMVLVNVENDHSFSNEKV